MSSARRKLDDDNNTEEDDRPTKKTKTTTMQQSEPEDDPRDMNDEPSPPLNDSKKGDSNTIVEDEMNGSSVARRDNQDNESNIMFPGTNDVLLGRGRTIQKHGGNLKMLEIVHGFKQEYNQLGRSQRRAFCEMVLDEVLKATSGRFLKFERTHWTVVSRDVALDKVSHALRSRRRRDEEQKESEDSEGGEEAAEQHEEPQEEGSPSIHWVSVEASRSSAGVDDPPDGDSFARPSTHHRDSLSSSFLPQEPMADNASLLLAQAAIASHPYLVAQLPQFAATVPPLRQPTLDLLQNPVAQVPLVANAPLHRDLTLEEVVDCLAWARLAQASFPWQNMR